MAVSDNILAYMNARGNKQYTKYQLGAIRAAVRTEFITRDKSDILLELFSWSFPSQSKKLLPLGSISVF